MIFWGENRTTSLPKTKFCLYNWFVLSLLHFRKELGEAKRCLCDIKKTIKQISLYETMPGETKQGSYPAVIYN